MARQDGLLSLNGKIGKIRFYRTKNGYGAKESQGMDGKRIATDPRYARVRENGAEFGRACRASKTLRYAFKNAVKLCGDSKIVGRLTQQIMRVIKADATSDRGLRNATDGELGLLQGFEFNEAAAFPATFQAPYSASIDRASGELKISIPGFEADRQISVPQGATHFQIVSAGAAVDFANETAEVKEVNSAYLPVAGPATAAIDLVSNIAPNNPHPLMLVMGVVFFQEVKGKYYPLLSRAFNSLAVVQVEGV